MDHFLSPQAYIASVSYYDKYKTLTFFIRSYMTLGATSKKKAVEKPLGSFCLLLPFRLAVARSYGTMIYIYSHQKLGRILLVIIDLFS
jgi:hypothetical protein